MKKVKENADRPPSGAQILAETVELSKQWEREQRRHAEAMMAKGYIDEMATVNARMWDFLISRDVKKSDR